MATLSTAITLLWSTVAVVLLFIKQPLRTGKFPLRNGHLGLNGYDSSQIRGLGLQPRLNAANTEVHQCQGITKTCQGLREINQSHGRSGPWKIAFPVQDTLNKGVYALVYMPKNTINTVASIQTFSLSQLCNTRNDG